MTAGVERLRTVLLVEDDEMHAELVRRAFEHDSRVVLTVARRVDEAKATLAAAEPSILIADLRLPDGKGIDLCRKDSAYPVVIMTSQGSEADAVEAIRSGALDYVVKSDAMFGDMPHIVERTLREWNTIAAAARADRFLHAQYDVAVALATSSRLAQAAPSIVEAICRCVHWPFGELWRVDAEGDVLRREASWTDDREIAGRDQERARTTFRLGEGMPGAAWERGDSLYVPDVATWSGVRDREFMAEVGLHSAFAFPVRDAEGVFGVFTFFTRALEHHNGDIRRLSQTIAAQLGVFVARQRAEEARDRLQRELIDRERLAAIGETAATLAHEIGNPLNSMYMQGQLLQRRIAKIDGLDDKIAAGVETILSENRRLNALLDEFRSLSRRQILRRGPVDVCSLVTRVLATHHLVLHEHHVESEIDCEDGLPMVSADDAKLTQVVLNLVKNAIEAMPGGGTLVARAFRQGECVAIEITDTGSGIPDGINVFEPFRTTKAAGTGLGLSVARQILAAHDGTIDYRSTVGAGTTFRVVLPIGPGEAG